MGGTGTVRANVAMLSRWDERLPGKHKEIVELKVMINHYTGIEPTKPMTNICPDAFSIRTLLIKPGYISHMIFYSLFSNLQALGKL